MDKQEVANQISQMVTVSRVLGLKTRLANF